MDRNDPGEVAVLVVIQMKDHEVVVEYLQCIIDAKPLRPEFLPLTLTLHHLGPSSRSLTISSQRYQWFGSLSLVPRDEISDVDDKSYI